MHYSFLTFMKKEENTATQQVKCGVEFVLNVNSHVNIPGVYITTKT